MTLGPHWEYRAARCWVSGMDTKAIAYALGVPEHVVYNRIDTIKAAVRGRPLLGLSLDMVGLGPGGVTRRGGQAREEE